MEFWRVGSIAGYVQKRNTGERLYFLQSSCLLWCRLEWLVVTSMVSLCHAKELLLNEQTQPATLPLLAAIANVTAKHLLAIKTSNREGRVWEATCVANGCTGFSSTDLTALCSCIHSIEFEVFRSTLLFPFFWLNIYNSGIIVYPESN